MSSSDPIARLNAALERRYRIEREIGEGGMATVYLADDLKHERKVALKVLKPELAAVVGAERFLAEIKTTANLQHPHILPLHDSGDADGFLFYVMPYVEGESLREKLDREHQLPVDEAVRIASDVAEALGYAHSHGVIHRDIKPANILIHAGRPVISDFGIALAVGVAGGGRLTETGLSLGTPHYMSPEQATGDLSVGAATDMYAVGCVLYEMLVGDPPYVGSTAQAILGKIVTGDADPVTKHRRSVPANVDGAIRRSLEKVPADRFSGMQEFTRALADPAFRYGEEAPIGLASSSAPWKVVAIAASALALIFAFGFGQLLLRPEPTERVSNLELSLPQGVRLGFVSGRRVSVSPDGSMVVLVGTSDDGVTQLWQRPLAEPSAVPISGTRNAMAPRFSPDGQSIVFLDMSGGVVRTVPLGGGTPRTVLSGGAVPPAVEWGADDFIYFTNVDGGLSRVSPAGGEPQVITTVREGESSHIDPVVLPDGDGILFSVLQAGPSTDRVIAVASPQTGEVTVLLRERGVTQGDSHEYAASGHIVYTSQDGVLRAVPFDPGRIELTGEPWELIDGVAVDNGPGEFALSQTGVLLYLPSEPGSRTTELVWVTRSGVATPVDADWQFNAPAQNYGWSLSPGGERVAYTNEIDLNVDLWIKQLPDGPSYPLTFSPNWEGNPTWTPDGQFVTYIGGVQGVPGGLDAWRKRADGTTEAELLLDDGRGLYQPDWSHDGQWLVFRTPTFSRLGSALGDRDILGFRPGVDSVASPLVAGAEFDESGPDLSPDGRWLAYTSDESGREEVYIRPFPEVGSGREPVSIDGGRNPQWAHSGTELFFVDGQRRMMAAQFETDPELRLVAREALFGLRSELYVPVDAGDDFYDVAPDDQMFLMARAFGATSADGAERFRVVQSFFEELKRLAPGN